MRHADTNKRFGSAARNSRARTFFFKVCSTCQTFRVMQGYVECLAFPGRGSRSGKLRCRSRVRPLSPGSRFPPVVQLELGLKPCRLEIRKSVKALRTQRCCPLSSRAARPSILARSSARAPCLVDGGFAVGRSRMPHRHRRQGALVLFAFDPLSPTFSRPFARKLQERLGLRVASVVSPVLPRPFPLPHASLAPSAPRLGRPVAPPRGPSRPSAAPPADRWVAIGTPSRPTWRFFLV